jgi:hypothetical protein
MQRRVMAVRAVRGSLDPCGSVIVASMSPPKGDVDDLSVRPGVRSVRPVSHEPASTRQSSRRDRQADAV